uniref:C-type lectin domain-containing protein n=1 Tax=Cyanistes caeruleus TaxID=156563 RepID=A0A8C0TYV9_CYACU
MAAAARLALLLLGCAGLLRPYCPEGWSYYKLSCFKYFPEPRTWDEAESRCQDVKGGAHLAWVEDSHEAATLQRAISYYQRVQPVWIGLQKSEKVRRGRQGWRGAGGQRGRAPDPPLSPHRARGGSGRVARSTVPPARCPGTVPKGGAAPC